MPEAVLFLLPLMAAHLAAAASPGPSFLLIARTATAQGRQAAFWQCIGLGLGATIWAAAALFGLTLLFEVAPWTLSVLRYAGAAFLIWIALQLWRHADTPLGAEGSARTVTGPRANIRRGLLLQLANPKVSIFFGSVFVTLVPPGTSVTMLTLLLGLIFLIEAAWYGSVTIFFAMPAMKKRYIAAKAWIDRLCGGVLGLLGLRLAIS